MEALNIGQVIVGVGGHFGWALTIMCSLFLKHQKFVHGAGCERSNHIHLLSMFDAFFIGGKKDALHVLCAFI